MFVFLVLLVCYDLSIVRSWFYNFPNGHEMKVMTSDVSSPIVSLHQVCVCACVRACMRARACVCVSTWGRKAGVCM